MKFPKNTPPLVMIEWEDSVHAHSGWQWLDQITGPSAIRCYSAGFLVKDGEDEKRLAVSVGTNSEAEVEQASGVIAIPTRAIVQIRPLRASR